ncbi:MAG: FecR domain-containing protein [Methanobacteriota archaeon]
MLPSNVEGVEAQLIIDSGIVQIKHTGGSWTPAQNNMTLHQSDSIKTGTNASASVVFFESSTIRLANNTEITLVELFEQEGLTKVTIQQDEGKTWNTVLKISGIDDYEVQTPTTVASVRGTAFYVNVQTTGRTHVGVGHGVVNVSSTKNGQIIHTIQVNTNESVIIDPDTIEQPLEIKPFEKDDWILHNQELDDENVNAIKQDIFARLQPYIPELKERYGVTDQELDVLIDGYIRGYFNLPSETPQWIKDIIEKS